MPVHPSTIAPFLAAIIVLAMTSSVHAMIIIGFVHEECAWSATDIVVATQGKNPTDPVKILEVWKGNLKPNDSVLVDGLLAVPITVSTQAPPRADAAVTGNRIILFLAPVTDPNNPDQPVKPTRFVGASRYTDHTENSTVWVTSNGVYAFDQFINPGPSELQQLEKSEATFKKETLAFVEAKEALQKAQAIADPARRVLALTPFTLNGCWHQIDDAFDALGKCGKDALPILRPMLRDGRHHQDRVVQAIVVAAGDQAGPELTAILSDELAFWKQIIPILPANWLNAEPADLRTLLRNRDEILRTTLNGLCIHPDPNAHELLIQLKEAWATRPELKDKYGSERFADYFQTILKATTLPPPAAPPATK